MPPTEPMRATETFAETHRSFVNTWECDENGHMNVQFYFRTFQEASEIFAVMAGRPNPEARSAIVRHVRYHRELHSARPTLVRSAILAQGEAAGSIVHFMFDAETGKLAATALDQPGYRCGDAPVTDASTAAPALPRGVAHGPAEPVDTGLLLQHRRALVSHRSIVRSGETGPDGDLLSNAIISRFTDGAPHAWTLAGIGSDWLTSTNHGRVAVEMKLTRLKRADAGAALALVSWIDKMEAKTFVIRHQLEELRSAEAVASGEVRCLVMNLETRRAVAMPDFALREFASGHG